MPDRRLSVIIPARNECRLISRTLDCVLRAVESFDSDDYEIIVVDNASSDGTWEILQEYTKRPSIRTFQFAGLGAARARNFGRMKAGGRILVFVDADTQIPVEALSRIVAHCEERGVGAGITRLIGMEGGLRAILWWSFWEHVRRLPLAHAKAMPAFMFCTAEVFDVFGPFDEGVAIGEEWPILAGLYRSRPRGLIYDRTVAARTSNRRMDQQAFGYTRTFFKYVWAILHRSGRIHYTDRIR